MAGRVHREGILLNGFSAQAVGPTALDLRASNGSFFRYSSASGDGPTAGASANFQLLHSHDLTAWTVLEEVTAVEGAVATAFHSDGAYGYIKASANLVYSAAQTGTGSVWVFVHAGIN